MLTTIVIVAAVLAPVLAVLLWIALHQLRQSDAELERVRQAATAAEIAAWQQRRETRRVTELAFVLIQAAPEALWRAGYRQAAYDYSEAVQLAERETVA